MKSHRGDLIKKSTSVSFGIRAKIHNSSLGLGLIKGKHRLNMLDSPLDISNIYEHI